MPNHLISESSPYLLQHANNPVNWHAWNDATLALAKKENKLLLVSIGYSACHWCHVMEHECFEDVHVAKLMNEHFINIKVDREERPDIDMVYMGAVQLMTGQGGWPLNCFALPNGQPIYGGTYFPKQQWVSVLENLADLFQTNSGKAQEYANHLTSGLQQLELPEASMDEVFNMDTLRQSVGKWKQNFDTVYGGANRAPKFPLPNNYLFLMYYNYFENDRVVQKHIDLTLTKMANGGIYDHLAGGFARYSTDVFWKVPHFEKMLYDNAQLISLYTQAYKQQSNPLYKKVVYETIHFVKHELMNEANAFYSALDADSEGVEGKYYIWTKEELHLLLKNNYEVFSDYYSVNETGYWEDDNYILLREESHNNIALKYHTTINELNHIINNCKEILLVERTKRVKPGLDNKVIASWNGLMCKALAEAYLVFDEPLFHKLALANAQYLLKHHVLSNGSLLRIKNEQTNINGFLDDYAFVIDAFMATYLITANNMWLFKAKELTDYTLKHFYDAKANTFFYTDDSQEKLVVRKAEWSDNVIPASSSQMAINLQKLGVYFEESYYIKISENILKSILSEIVSYGAGYSNWAILLWQYIQPQTEVVIVGKSVNEIMCKLYKQTPPNVIFALSDQSSDLPLVKNRYINEQTTIYICKNKNCLLPMVSIDDALKQFEKTTI